MNEQIATWIKIGRKNPWIREANDPPFDEHVFEECASVEVLKARLSHGNWCLAQAFYWQDLCFINQVDGGDEWLVIKGDLAFESLTAEPMIESGRFDDFLRRVMAATREQLQALEY